MRTSSIKLCTRTFLRASTRLLPMSSISTETITRSTHHLSSRLLGGGFPRPRGSTAFALEEYLRPELWRGVVLADSERPLVDAPSPLLLGQLDPHLLKLPSIFFFDLRVH